MDTTEHNLVINMDDEPLPTNWFVFIMYFFADLQGGEYFKMAKK